jgi:cytoskeletal protein RodZ
MNTEASHSESSPSTPAAPAKKVPVQKKVPAKKAPAAPVPAAKKAPAGNRPAAPAPRPVAGEKRPAPAPAPKAPAAKKAAPKAAKVEKERVRVKVEGGVYPWLLNRFKNALVDEVPESKKADVKAAIKDAPTLAKCFAILNKTELWTSDHEKQLKLVDKAIALGVTAQRTTQTIEK